VLPPFVVDKDLSVKARPGLRRWHRTSAWLRWSWSNISRQRSLCSRKVKSRISEPKTKVVNFGYDAPVITLDGTSLEVVPTFVYLGFSLFDDSTASSDEVDCRIGKESGVFARLKESVWKRHNISLRTKMKIFNAVVIITLLYTLLSARRCCQPTWWN